MPVRSTAFPPMMLALVDDVGGCAEQRLHDAAAGWIANPHVGPATLIRAAGQALVTLAPG
jgi:hypothetical protein